MDGATVQHTGEAVVRLESVEVTFGGEYALRRTSLGVGVGQAAVVSGPSGSGKSTLLRAAAGLLEPTAGVVVLWEEAGAQGRRIGLTLDEPRLWPWLSARETVVCLAGLAGAALPRADAVALLEELNLGDAVRVRAGKLSQGMRRRVALAGALAVGTDLLLLDEPTASLDADNGEIVWRTLERRRAAGVPMIVASHDDGWRGRLEASSVALEAT